MPDFKVGDVVRVLPSYQVQHGHNYHNMPLVLRAVRDHDENLASSKYTYYATRMDGAEELWVYDYEIEHDPFLMAAKEAIDGKA